MSVDEMIHPEKRGRLRWLHSTANMTIGKETHPVGRGDAIAIPPGQVHAITNTGTEMLTFLCCCAPGYEHDDTLLVDP